VVSSVRWLAPGQQDREEVSAAAERLLRAITDSVPKGFAHQGEALSGTDVRSINIVLAATAVTSDEVGSLLSTSWQENVVVSPESRQRPGAADTFNDASDIEAWAAFIAASVASLAGLWTGMTSTPILKTTGSGMVSDVPHVRVARTFTRAVVSSGYTFRLARKVTERLASNSDLLTDPLITSRLKGVFVFDEDEADAEIARALEYLKRADSGVLTYQPLPNPEQLAPRKFRFRDLGEFLAFSFDKVVAIPSWIYAWVVDRASRKVQATVVGDAAETGIVVDFRDDVGLRQSDRDMLEIAEQLRAMRAQLQARLNAPYPTIRRLNAPTLWKNLRSVIFTLADGGSDNAEFEATTISSRRGLIADLGLLVPLPNERWELPADARRYLAGDETVDISASWAGLKAAEALLTHLNQTASLAEARVTQLRESQERLLNDCFSAEREHVTALHAQQDASADLRVHVKEDSIYRQLEVPA